MLKIGGDLIIDAGETASVHGSQVEAGGDVTIAAGDDVSITSARNAYTFHAQSSGAKDRTVDQTGQKSIASTVAAGGSVTIASGVQHGETGDPATGSVNIHGSTVKAARDVTITSAENLNITAAQDENSYRDHAIGEGMMGTGSMELDEKRSVTTTRTRIEAGDKVALTATDDVTIQAASIASGDTTEITAVEGQVAMLVTKDVEYEHSMKSRTGFFKWSMKDKGITDEKIIHTLIEADGGLTITTPEGVVVEFKESTGDVRKDAELLSNVEGLEWMGDLLERDDVDWVAVQEIHDQWSKSDGGLGVGSMLIVAIVASVASAGAASELALTVMNLATLEGATAVELAVHAALKAGFVSLSAQVATSLADAAAGGDLGDNLANIVSVDGLRSLVATMVLAGTLDMYGKDFAGWGKLGEIMAISTVKTATSTIIEGEEIQDAFLTALGSTFASHAKGLITDKQLDETVELILAGATGAAGASIAGGDPLQGAMSAIVARLAGEFVSELSDEQKATDGPLAKISAAVYSDGELPEGVEPVDLDESTASLMENTDTGLKSKLYYNSNTDEYIIAFSGTNELLDWNTNIAQATGDVGAQYAQLREQLTAIKKVLPEGATIVATGHSLGGGIATAAVSTGFVDRAVVFNPAGVHENTITTLNPDDTTTAITNANKTTAYVSRGDFLTNLQDLFSFMLPTTVGNRVLVDGGGVHFMDDMIEAFYQ